MLELHDLRKSYGAQQAVKGISFAIRAGETLGLLGPNGAGKTTTVSIIAGLLTPDAGEVRLAGQSLRGDTDPLKARIGLVPQDLALFEDLSARDNLSVFGALYGASDELHQYFNPPRDADVFDVVADTIGAGIGATALYAWGIIRGRDGV